MDRPATPMLRATSIGCLDEEGDWIVCQFVSPAELRLSPEEYVAHHADALGAFSFPMYQFQDLTLAAWVGQVGKLLSSEQEIARCRERFLSPDELALTRRQDSEPL